VPGSSFPPPDGHVAFGPSTTSSPPPLCTNRVSLDIHGFNPTGAPGNLDAVRHFDTADALRADVENARVWGGLHYRFSTIAGVDLGRDVARYDLRHGFANGCDRH